MVQAILGRRKTQTRRVVKIQPYRQCVRVVPHGDEFLQVLLDGEGAEFTLGNVNKRLKCPYGKVGDHFWVRETFYQRGNWQDVPNVKTKTGRQKWQFVPVDDVIVFEPPETLRKGRHHKDPYTIEWHKRLGRFMPKKYSRTTLEIIDIRVERLQDISTDDAISEGLEIKYPYMDGQRFYNGIVGDPIASFKKLWESINGTDSWDENPWVWVVKFKVIKK